MKVKVMQKYPSKWDYQGQFPTFEKGTSVTLAEAEDEEFPGWYASDILGHKPFTPQIFVHDGKLTRDYNPTELIQESGDILEVHEIVHSWLLASNDKGITGWIPTEVVVSINTL